MDNKHNKKFLIFSDIDGSFMNHRSYSYSTLKKYILLLKNHCQVIFNSSKTFAEINELNKSLKILSPFIVENGACIFFPRNYNNIVLNKNFFKYNEYLGYKLTNKNSELLISETNHLKKKYKFSFLSEITDLRLKKISNLNIQQLKRSRMRMFSNPILWEDKETKKDQFSKEINSLGYEVSYGGRFLHLCDSYNKGKAVNEFLAILKLNKNLSYKTISIGDSDNDLSMLEQTDYSCIIKSSKKKLLLNKKKNNYYSKNFAPEGWRESLEYIFKKENINF
tara:strand:+ start:341 stop:1177 length:837 start_codon:yes stop_codon:yes gene_type:complete